MARTVTRRLRFFCELFLHLKSFLGAFACLLFSSSSIDLFTGVSVKTADFLCLFLFAPGCRCDALGQGCQTQFDPGAG